MSYITDTKQRILDTIRALGRPGTEAVIDYLNHSTFFRAQHSIEVYDHMLAHAGGFPSDSIAVVALFHDLGKTRRRDGRGHGRRSVDILTECGYPLTADERTAIGLHHERSVESLSCALRLRLTAADCSSTGAWKRAHHQHRNNR